MPSKRISRRDMLKGFGLAAAGMVLAAGSGCQKKAATSAPVSSEPVEVEVWVQEAFGKEAWQSVDDAFHAAQDAVKVKRSIFPHGDMEAKVLTSLAGGEKMDVIYVHPMFNNTYAIKGAIIPLDAYMPDLGIPRDDWYPVIDYHTWRGKTWALPYQDNPFIVGYNPDLVAEAGLTEPRELWKEGKWTKEVYDEYVEKLTKGEGADKQFGTNMTGRGSIRVYPAMWLWGFGSSVFNADESETMITEPKAIEAWNDMSKYLKNEWAPSPGDMEGVSGAAMWERVVFGSTSRWTIMQAKKTDTWPNMRMVPMFDFPVSGKGEVRDATNACAIFTNSEKRDAAWKFVKWMTIDGHVELIKLGWVTPIRRSLMDEQYWVDQLNMDIEDPEVYKEGAENVRYMSHVVRITEIDTMTKAAFDSIILGEKTAEAAMAEIKPDIDAILAETAETALPDVS